MDDQMKDKSKAGGLTSFSLHLLAMGLMLCDHMWATVVPGANWLTWIGRIAFPLFAFMLVEGFFRTGNLKKYLRRLLIFAVISEIPFNMMYYTEPFFPYNQNVLWSFLIGLLCIAVIDRVRKKENLLFTVPVIVIMIFVGIMAGMVSMADYGMYSVMTVFVFYFFYGDKLWQRLGQLAGIVYINVFVMSGLVVPVEMFSFSFEFPQQAMAVLALIPIWLYRGEKGPGGKWIRLGYYAFYPVHMLVLGMIVWMR